MTLSDSRQDRRLKTTLRTLPSPQTDLPRLPASPFRRAVPTAAQLITSMEAVTPTEATIIGPETGKEVLPLSPASIEALPSAAEGFLGNVL
jgi:hypothetical protein